MIPIVSFDIPFPFVPPPDVAGGLWVGAIWDVVVEVRKELDGCGEAVVTTFVFIVGVCTCDGAGEVTGGVFEVLDPSE